MVTQPDRARGRGQQVSDSPVKARAAAAGVPILQPMRLKDPEFLDAFRAWNADLGVVAAYGRLLPQALLDLPPLGLLNVHASLLPAWRGASPIQRAILEWRCGQRRDHHARRAGARCGRDARTCRGADRAGRHDGLARTAPRRVRSVAAARSGRPARSRREPSIEEPQDDALATLAPKIEKQEGLIDWTRPAHALDCHVRGMQPWPGAFTFVDGQRLVVREATADARPAGDVEPGGVVALDGDAIVFACGQGTTLARRAGAA